TTSLANMAYYGSVTTGNPLLVPEDPSVELAFSLVNLSAAPGVVHFAVKGLAPGTSWQLMVNGTEYSSSSSEINVTLRPGNYSIAPSPIVLSNGTTRLAASASLIALSVTPGGTYVLNYTPEYRVDYAATAGGSVAGPGQLWLNPGTGATLAASPPGSGYTWGGWVGSGPGSYTGLSFNASIQANGPISEVATYLPLPSNRFNLTVEEVGIPTGTSWTVYLNGEGFASNGTSLVIPDLYGCAAGPKGQYTVLATVAYSNASSDLVRYVPTLASATGCGGSQVGLTFTTENYVSWQSTTGGTATILESADTVASAPGAGWFADNTTLGLRASAATGYHFAGWNGTGPGSYTGATRTEEVTPTGPVTESATFLANARSVFAGYTLTISAGTSIPNGTTWTIGVGNTTYSADTPTLVVPGLPAGPELLTLHSALSPDGLTEYLPSGLPRSITLTGNASKELNFATEYWVAISNAGPG
ncbi:MAG: InlB B-repeat-containing protein, partial [Thermoplasmata archaeon]